VGFIRELPHELVAAFQSTLQEARSAQLLLHVIDASDPRHDEYTGQVNAVLAEIGAGELPQLLVYNKIDRLGVEPRVERGPEGEAAQVWISAAQARGLELLRAAIAERLQLHAQRGWLRIPAAAGALRAQLLARGAVREEQTEEDGTLRLLVELPAPQLAALARNPQLTLSLLPSGPPCAGGLPYLESTGPVPPGARYAGRLR
jgi:GTP-binding protein HflX